MYSCYYSLFILLIVNSRLFLSIGENICQTRDIVLYEHEYFLASDTCQTRNSTLNPKCEKCDLLLHHQLCLTEGKFKWCDESISCGSFRCSAHQYDALKTATARCVRPTPCGNTNNATQCGVYLTSLNSAGITKCIPITASWRAERSVRFTITNIDIDFFENTTNIDSSQGGPMYMRVYGTPPGNGVIQTFLHSCALNLLNQGRFIFLYFPHLNSGIEFGGHNLHHPKSNSTIFWCTKLKKMSSSEFRTMRTIIMFTGITLSLIGLLLTAIASLLLVEHRTVPGYNLLSLVASLFVTYVCVPIGVFNQSSNICLVSGFIHVLTVLASVFWMNVLAFDIWQSLSTVQHLDQYRTSEHYWRVVRYSCYAWGVPVLVLTLGGVLDKVDGIPDQLRPGFVAGCWFRRTHANTLATKLMYHGLIGVVMMANVVFFLLTARIVFQAQRQRLTNMRVADSQRYHFSLYVKLFLVMGLTWVMEALTGPIKSPYYGLVSDVVNTLQGFFIFFIFGCKMRVLRRLQRCFGGRKQRLTTGATYASSYPSTSFRSERDISFKIANNTRNCSTTTPLSYNDSSI